jgi:hypothetical protein
MHEYSGMAPEAKLLFFDLMAGGEDGSLEVPDALEADYFSWAYDAGMRLFLCVHVLVCLCV